MIWSTVPDVVANLQPHRKPYRPPYQKTGKVLTDALLFTAHLFGATAIHFQAGLLTCVYQGKQKAIPITPKTRPMDILDWLFAQAIQGGGESQSDPSIEFYNPHYHKLSEVS